MKRILCVAALLLGILQTTCFAETFQFGGNANGLTDHAAETISRGEFRLTLKAGPAGALLNENDNGGLGINTRGIDGVPDGGSGGEPDKFNIIDGTAPVSGQGESVLFSFDRAGQLQGLLFDGLKDETLEYFTIEFPDGSITTFFDFEVDRRLTDQGFSVASLGVANPVLADGASDDFTGINYRFAAGEEFAVSYGEIAFTTVLPGYAPTEAGVGNGARFEGIVVVAVPESSSAMLTLVAASLLLSARAHRGG